MFYRIYWSNLERPFTCIINLMFFNVTWSTTVWRSEYYFFNLIDLFFHYKIDYLHNLIYLTQLMWSIYTKNINFFTFVFSFSDFNSCTVFWIFLQHHSEILNNDFLLYSYWYNAFTHRYIETTINLYYYLFDTYVSENILCNSYKQHCFIV